MEFVEAGDARVPINKLALLTLGANEGWNWRNWMLESHKYGTARDPEIGAALAGGSGVADDARPPWHGGAANYGFLASDRFRSRAPVGGEMDRVTRRLHIDRIVLLVNAGHRMSCRRYGHDHRPAMITKAHKPVILAQRLGTFLGSQGTPERAGPRPLAPDPRSFAVDHPSFFSACSCPSYGAESMIEASVSANGASPVDSQFEPIQKPSTAVSFSP
jgi:hypothetical protein